MGEIRSSGGFAKKITKDDLKSYRYLSVEIIQLQQEMEKLKKDIPENMAEDFIEDIRFKKYFALYEKIRFKKESLIYLLDTIEDSVSKLDPIERVLVREYYINGSKWEKVADRIGYSWAQTHRHHRKALEKMLG